jgi:hypothetical protein
MLKYREARRSNHGIRTEEVPAVHRAGARSDLVIDKNVIGKK